MGKGTPGMLKTLSEQIDAVAGPGARETVMAGSEIITARTDGAKVAAWVKGAMERIDKALPPEDVIKIMEGCGANCASINHRVVDQLAARRKKYTNEDDFIAAEVNKPGTGVRLERRGDELHLFYTPLKYTHQLRCYCSLVNQLPPDETMSSTYCQCSKMLVKIQWETALGRSLDVQLLTSAIMGSNECEFLIPLR
jgi:hypothetical protein